MSPQRSERIVILIGIIVILCLFVWSRSLQCNDRLDHEVATFQRIISLTPLTKGTEDESITASTAAEDAIDDDINVENNNANNNNNEGIQLIKSHQKFDPKLEKNITSFYEGRFLPRPQLTFPIGKPLRYQMHNCIRGRDGSKLGMRTAGIPWLSEQRSSFLHEVKTGVKNPSNNLRVFEDAQVILACNNERPSIALSKHPAVNGKKLVSTTIGLVDKHCLGSVKIEQLKCRRELAKKMGCDYDNLGIQPAQYILRRKDECLKFLSQQKGLPWLLKPSASARGIGIKYFQETEQVIKEIEAKGGCDGIGNSEYSNYLVQSYVANPALLDKKFKFDVRSWLLIASVDPLIIFYHDGFVRVAKTAYGEKSNNRFAHITNLGGSQYQPHSTSDSMRQGDYKRTFETAQKELHESMGLPEDYMTNEFRKKINRAQIFAALSQFMRPPALKKRKGFYHVYACDSVVDRFGGVHLLECNGFPGESQQTEVENGPRDWSEMAALVLNLHLEPWRLFNNSAPPPDTPVVKYPKRGKWKWRPKVVGDKLEAGKYKFGTWELAFNELETPLHTVNLCKKMDDSNELLRKKQYEANNPKNSEPAPQDDDIQLDNEPSEEEQGKISTEEEEEGDNSP